MKTLPVKTLGLTGPQWIMRLEKDGYRVSSYAKDVLNSPDYKPMKKGVQVELAFVSVKDMGKEWATTAEIQAYAASKGYEMPTPEIALLVREAMSDADMEALGVWYVAVLHAPIKDADGDPRVLNADRGGGGRWVSACWGGPGRRWAARGAFAFLVPASSTETSGTKDSLDTLPLADDIATAIGIVKDAGYVVYKPV